MREIKKFIVPGVIFLITLFTFRGWLSTGILSTGDWPFLFPQAIKENVPLSIWDPYLNGGLGQNALHKFWMDSYALTILELAEIIPWQLFERFVWFFPFVIISFFSAYLLAGKVGIEKKFLPLAGFIYSINTYILLIVSGGQVGIMMAYAVLPLTFFTLFSVLSEQNFKRSILHGLTIATLIMLDLRIGYIFLFSQSIIFILSLINNPKNIIKAFSFSFLLPGVIVTLLHAHWIFPIFILGANPTHNLPSEYTDLAILDFFSFAKFENAISFLHPNWPENIFGKVSFLKPEFLIIPLLAFLSLVFLKKKDSSKFYVLVFTILSLIGIFLSKGVNDPFGEVYRFVFNNLPGFVMFRDPTKWYMLIAVGYSILIPFSLSKISNILEKKNIKNISIFIPLIFILIWAVLISDGITGNMGGTLAPKGLPKNYASFADLLSHDSDFYRTLWVPNRPTFGYTSANHPAINGELYFKESSVSGILEDINDAGTLKKLSEASVRYVIIPDDIEGKIFVTDRKRDEKKYLEAISEIENIEQFKKVEKFGKLKVFEIPGTKNHFWSEKEGLVSGFKYITPTKYHVEVKNAKRGDMIIFAENYDAYWYAIREEDKDKVPLGHATASSPHNGHLNSFVLKHDGDYTLEIFYLPQRYVNIGLVISGLTLVFCLSLILYLKKKK